jgi:hypothetical protein
MTQNKFIIKDDFLDDPHMILNRVGALFNTFSNEFKLDS